MKTIAIENGLDTVVSKPADMGGSRADQLGAAAGGLVIALRALLEEAPRLRRLPQFANLEIPPKGGITVSIQGFGAVGAHTAFMLEQDIPGVRVVGISDALGYLYDGRGLPLETLFRIWEERGHVTRNYFQDTLISDQWGVSNTKYSSAPNDLLREPAFCLIPASPVSNYLDLDEGSAPTMTVDRMGGWALIIEGANTYSSERGRRAARSRMEHEVYRRRGVLIATDFLVNSGAVIFAAQEQLIKTPGSLRIPDEMLGDRPGVERWLIEHADELNELAEKRRRAAEACREEIIRKNMRELVDLLAGDADRLPCEAAESISIRRITRRENDRTAAEIMTSIPTLSVNHTVAEAAALLIQANSPLLGVVKPTGELAGVVTQWDVTRSTALGGDGSQPLEQVMSRQVAAVGPKDPILDIVRKLELNEVTAMPVVEDGYPIGMVSADLLARRSLLGLLQSEDE
jgi:glutamate dehydrogenase (NAD(P)+)